MIRILIVFSFIGGMIILNAACQCQKKSVISATTSEPFTSLELQVDPEMTFPEETNYKITMAEIKDNFLYVTVGYSGGCKEHTFNMNWNGRYLKSQPMQINLVIMHDNGEDLCEQWITEQFRCDLSTFAENGQKELLINLFSWSEAMVLRRDQ